MNDSFQCLRPTDLDRFLVRRRRSSSVLASETSLVEQLVEVVRRANEFVDSSCGALLLDDPSRKQSAGDRGALTYITTFGSEVEELLGQEISSTGGVAGHVYQTGEPLHLESANRHELTTECPGQVEAESLLALPLRLGRAVCGVLVLGRQEPYTDQETKLLASFAAYLSISIENVLDARQATEIAKRDNLTGLFNDRYLHYALSEQIESCVRENLDLALLFIDLDHFKRINDTHGHLAGSQVLREVGALLQVAADAAAGLAARYGGDEFVVILPGSDLERAVDLADEIRQQIAEGRFCTDPKGIHSEPLFIQGLTCSIGAASLARNMTPAAPEGRKTTLLHLADAAMYVAKETGRNRTAIASQPLPRKVPSKAPETLPKRSSLSRPKSSPTER